MYSSNASKIALTVRFNSQINIYWPVLKNHLLYSSLLCTELVIGFIDAPYEVNENDGFAAVNLGVIDGSLEREFEVQLSLADETALGEL